MADDKPMCPHCHKRPAILRITDNHTGDHPSSSAPCCNNLTCIRLSAFWCMPLDADVVNEPLPPVGQSWS